MAHKQVSASMDRREKIAKLWSKGLSLAQIAERTGYSKGAVSDHLAALGLVDARKPRKAF